MSKDKITESLNISDDFMEYIPNGEILELSDNKTIVNTKLNENASNDYIDARKSIKSLISTGESVIPELADIALQSESPMAYKALSSAIKSLAEMNKMLLELTAQQKDLIGGGIENNDPQQNITNNNVFVGSTEELLRMIRNENNKRL